MHSNPQFVMKSRIYWRKHSKLNICQHSRIWQPPIVATMQLVNSDSTEMSMNSRFQHIQNPLYMYCFYASQGWHLSKSTARQHSFVLYSPVDLATIHFVNRPIWQRKTTFWLVLGTIIDCKSKKIDLIRAFGILGQHSFVLVLSIDLAIMQFVDSMEMSLHS